MRLERLPVYDSALLLQGPVGPFFARLSDWLRTRGTQTYKVNFNLADDWFFPEGAFHFRDPIDALEAYVERTLDVTGAKAIFLFGEYRPIHQAAIRVAQSRGLHIWAFEEGFIRPGYITLEALHNAGEVINRVCFSNEEVVVEDHPEPQPLAGQWMMWWAFLYFFIGLFSRFKYPHYQHHKPFSFMQGWYWWRWAARKLLYRLADRSVAENLLDEYSGRIFLVPLQVADDYAVRARSEFADVRTFIIRVVRSFARHAPKGNVLVIKHHPMDRGHRHYGRLIRSLARRLGVADRVYYLHDAHLPTLLKASRGVVYINSTSGLQAMFHGVPLLPMGTSLWSVGAEFDTERLQHFWQDPPPVDLEDNRRFIRRLVHYTQIPGSFYQLDWIAKKAVGLSKPQSFGYLDALRVARARMNGFEAKLPILPPKGFVHNAAKEVKDINVST